MASKIAEAYVQIVPRIDGVASSINSQLSGPMGAAGVAGGEKFGGGLLSSVKRFAGPMAATLATAGVAKFFKDSISAASNFQAEFEGVNQTFGKFAGEVQAYAKNAAATAGLSEVEALRSAKSFGVFAKSAGLGGKAAATFSTDMVQLAGDLGSFNDVPVSEALAAIQSGLLGQSEPLRKFGVLLDDATLKARAQEMGIYSGTGALSAQQKVLAAQAEILAQTNLQQGDFVKYQNDFGNALKTTEAGFENVKKSVGVAFLPAMSSIVVSIRDNVVPTLQKMADGLPAFFASLSSPEGIIKGLSQASASVVAWVNGGGIQSIITGFGQMRSGIISALAQSLPEILTTLASSILLALPSIIQTILSMIPQILDTGLTLFNSLVTAATTAIPHIISALVGMLPRIISALVSALPMIIDAGLRLFLGIIDGLIVALPLIITALVSAIPKILDALIGALPQLIDAAFQLFVGIVEGIAEALPEIIAAVIELIPVIVKALNDAMPKLVEAGIAILTGLAKGIIDNAPRIIGAAIKGVADLVTTTFKNLLGIKSPSKVFMGYGENIGEGLVDGIDSMKSAVEKSAYELGSYANKGFTMSLKELTEAGNYGTLAGTKFFKATSSSDIASYLSQGGVLDVNGVTVADINAALNADAAGADKAAKGAKKSGKGYYSNPALMALLEKAGYSFADGYSKQLEGQYLQDLSNRLTGGFSNTYKNASGRVMTQTSSPIVELTSEFLNAGILPQGAKVSGSSVTAVQDFIAKQKANLEAVGAGALGDYSRAVALADLEKAEALLPKLARGGYVDKPTRALIGEAGPEVVTPLKDFERMMGIGNFERQQQKVLHYHAAPNVSIDREEALFKAMRRAKVVAGW